MTQLLPPKKEVALALLERSNVDIYLDPRAEGVVVPPQFKKEPRLILKIGLNMPVPIPDLRLDDESMSCTLSFNRSPFYCIVPWTSVFAMVGEDGRGMVWPDDVPQELAVRVVEESAKQGSGDQLPASSERGEGAEKPKRGKRTAAERDAVVKEVPSDRDRPSRPKSGRGNGKKKKRRASRARGGAECEPEGARARPGAHRREEVRGQAGPRDRADPHFAAPVESAQA